MRHIVVYNAIQISLFVYEFKILVCFPCRSMFCTVMVRVLLHTLAILSNFVIADIVHYFVSKKGILLNKSIHKQR